MQATHCLLLVVVVHGVLYFVECFVKVLSENTLTVNGMEIKERPSGKLSGGLDFWNPTKHLVWHNAKMQPKHFRGTI